MISCILCGLAPLRETSFMIFVVGKCDVTTKEAE